MVAGASGGANGWRNVKAATESEPTGGGSKRDQKVGEILSRLEKGEIGFDEAMKEIKKSS